jgi:hypothetical protein
MSSKGAQLWSVRHQVLTENHDKLSLSSFEKRKLVKLLCDPHSLNDLETQRGIDKIQDPKQNRKALTVTVGKEWTQQRTLVSSALTGLPKLSLQATSFIDWRKILFLYKTTESESCVTLDLKEVVVEATLEWNIGLFFGTTETNSESYKILKSASLEYWRQTRALEKNQASIQRALKTFEDSLPWNTNSNASNIEYGGILKTLHTSGLTAQQATDNAVNAMIASLDAVQSLVFWTLWNLSKTMGAWETCAATNDRQAKHDMLQLSIFKKQATQGKAIELNGMSYMGRALVETVRVYPPVWTLPRNWYDNEFVSSKFDILSCNHATERNWDPSSDNVLGTIASFGLGKRHCPAGTAGLYAAYEMIRQFIKSCKAIEECEPNKALNYCYLGPTLCIHGPQFFRVALRDD